MALNELEGVDGRFARDVAEQSAERQSRNYEFQDEERLGRLYVDPDTSASEFDGYVFPEEA